MMKRMQRIYHQFQIQIRMLLKIHVMVTQVKNSPRMNMMKNHISYLIQALKNQNNHH